MIRIGIITLAWVIVVFGPQFRAEADHTQPESQDKLILGWLEKIVLKPWDVVLRAKLDTGANTASIDAEDIALFEKDEQTWVRFAIIRNRRTDKPNHRIEIERPLVRTVLIREHFWESQERPVVSLEFCLNGTLFEAEFNLVNRTNFKYPVLLGRRFLQRVAIIDPEATLLTHTILRDCKRRDIGIAANNDQENDQNPDRPLKGVQGDEREAGETSGREPAERRPQKKSETEDSARPEISNQAAADPDRIPQRTKDPSGAARLGTPRELRRSLPDRAEQDLRGIVRGKTVRRQADRLENEDQLAANEPGPDQPSKTRQPRRPAAEARVHRSAAQASLDVIARPIENLPEIALEHKESPVEIGQNTTELPESAQSDDMEASPVKTPRKSPAKELRRTTVGPLATGPGIIDESGKIHRITNPLAEFLPLHESGGLEPQFTEPPAQEPQKLAKK